MLLTDRRRVGRMINASPLRAPGNLPARAREFRPGRLPAPPRGPLTVRKPDMRPDVPRGRATFLGDPYQPSTVKPRWRWQDEPAAIHERRFKPLPAVGARTPFQGRYFELPGGRLGGVPTPLRGVLARIGDLSRLSTVHAAGGIKSEDVRRRDLARMAVRRLKPKVRLGAGPGGLAFAQGRTGLAAPFWQRASVTIERARKLRGSMNQHRMAPASVVDALAAARTPAPPNVPESDTSTAAPDALPASAVTAALEDEASSSSSSSSAPGLLTLGVAVLGFMLLRRAAA